MNQYVEQVTGNKESQVHFYSQDIHVANEDLEHVEKVTNFTGVLSHETVYVN